MLPDQHLVDSGYVDADLLVASQRDGIELVGPERGTHIDLRRRQVELASGAEPLAYDLLVYALGSHADLNAEPRHMGGR